MPAIEFLYIWNMFAIIDNAPHFAEPILERVEAKMVLFQHQRDLSEEESMDELALCLLLKGMCLRSLGYPLQAQECFLEVINNDKRLKESGFLAPHCCMELGLTLMRRGEDTLAREWLEKSRKQYTGYLLETLVHFRVHCALRSIRTKEKARRGLSLSRTTSVEEGEELGEGREGKGGRSPPLSPGLEPMSLPCPSGDCGLTMACPRQEVNSKPSPFLAMVRKQLQSEAKRGGKSEFDELMNGSQKL
jgi:hypothetical protein